MQRHVEECWRIQLLFGVFNVCQDSSRGRMARHKEGTTILIRQDRGGIGANGPGFGKNLDFIHANKRTQNRQWTGCLNDGQVW
jgi:hypothetical protein